MQQKNFISLDYAAYQFGWFGSLHPSTKVFYASWCLRRFWRRKDDNVVVDNDVMTLNVVVAIDVLVRLNVATNLLPNFFCPTTYYVRGKFLFLTTFVEAIFERKTKPSSVTICLKGSRDLGPILQNSQVHLKANRHNWTRSLPWGGLVSVWPDVWI